MAGEDEATRISITKLSTFAQAALLAAGLASEPAETVARSLVTADARSLTSHGVVRLLPTYVARLQDGSTNALPDIRSERKLGSTAALDGDRGSGQVVGSTAMSLAIEMANQTGAGVVGVRNSTHYGIGALYAEQAIASGMIGIAMTNAQATMPPAGGRGVFFGTNPLTIGVPTGERNGHPILLDMSTSVVAKGKIMMAMKEGRTIPPGWAVDKDGNPTEDPAAAMLGAVLPMGGYKGAGLALMIDVLCGVLTGAAFGPHLVDIYDAEDAKQDIGHFFIAFSVESFMPIETFEARIAQFIEEIRAQPRLPDVDRILLPGQLEYESADRAHRDGVHISRSGLDELRELAEGLNLAPLA